MKRLILFISFFGFFATYTWADSDIQLPNTTQNAEPILSDAPAKTKNQDKMLEIDINRYLLAPGDVLEISVWKEEGLQQQQILVAPDGNITFPLAGSIVAAGKTIPNVEDAIAGKLSEFIADPVVNVKLLQNGGNTIFVIGKVNRPGQFPANRPIDVLQALSLAGGLNIFADTDDIRVLRRIGSEVKVFPFDYNDVLNGEHLEQNILLQAGDTVTVP
ncbi:MAG: polysaccharide biosynthesis/export family protein [Methylococcaceae bacterium]